MELAQGIVVRRVIAGPLEGLTKAELPAQLCTFAREVLRTEAMYEPGYYDIIHSHYWLSGQVGALARDRWGVPLVHSMHTMAKVKNRLLAEGDVAEPAARIIGEEQVVEAADLIIANTTDESSQLQAPVWRRTRARAGHHAWCRPRGLSTRPCGQRPRPPASRPEAGRHGGDVRREDPTAQGARRRA
ncbi:MAG: glycosyltransferase [Nocardioidaceae bacterium]